ncbi:MAG: hypothetical protein QXT63_08245, partial [Thermoplasmata archaeon]
DMDIQISITRNGTIYLVWYDMETGLTCTYSCDDGESFSEPNIITTNKLFSFSSAVCGEDLYVLYSTIENETNIQILKLGIISLRNGYVCVNEGNITIPKDTWNSFYPARIVSDGVVPYIFYTYSCNNTNILSVHTTMNGFLDDIVHEIPISKGLVNVEYYGAVYSGELILTCSILDDIYITKCNTTNYTPPTIAYTLAYPNRVYLRTFSLAVDNSGRILLSVLDKEPPSQDPYSSSTYTSEICRYYLLECNINEYSFHENCSEMLYGYSISDWKILADDAGIVYFFWSGIGMYHRYGRLC